MSRPQLYLIGCTTQVTAVLLTDTSKNQLSVLLIISVCVSVWPCDKPCVFLQTHTFSHDLDLHANFFMIHFVTNQHINLLLTADNNNGNVDSKSVNNNKQSVLEFDLQGSQKTPFLSLQVHLLLDTCRELGPTTTSCCIARQRLTRTLTPSLTPSLTRVSYVPESRILILT